MHPVDVLRAYGGHARSVDLLARTIRRRLDAALAAGEVVRTRRGVYVLPALPPPHVAAARAGGVLSHESAADDWGFSLLTSPTAVHVTSALAHGRLTASQLLAAAGTSPERGRSRRLRVARAADARSANAFESCLRGLVLDAGVTGLEPQLDIRLAVQLGARGLPAGVGGGDGGPDVPSFVTTALTVTSLLNGRRR